MSDYFGPGQPRVLDVSDRSLDQVVFQQTRPPLTSEWNLINQIGDFKSQQNIQTSLPSGWLKVGTVQDIGVTGISTSEASARSGQVLTSLTYGSNNFKLICRDTTNVAVINGWPFVVQTNLGITDIIMQLPGFTSLYRYDVIFLEVWKKLVSYTDLLYTYGNVDAGAFPDNEILWSAVGAESTKRVQLQYRIRTSPNSNPTGWVWNTSSYPDGLGQSDVYAVGGNPDGSYTSYSFTNAGEQDIGLYIAGDGSSTAQTELNTVDGYVYAIPMFMIYRRGYTPLVPFSYNNIFSSSILSTSGSGSDRPDGKYADIVYKDDIVDLRHQIVTSGKDLEGILQESFRKLATNQLSTTLGQGFTNGHAMTPCPGGSNLFKLEQIQGSIHNIGQGCATGDFKRRAYCNAQLISDHNVFVVPPLPNPNVPTEWGYGTIPVSSFFSSPIGEIISIDGVYFIDDGVGDSGAAVNVIYSNPTEIVLQPASIPPVTRSTSSCKLYIEFTFQYYAQPAGFFDVPKKFYEISNNVYQPIATRDQTIPVRFANGGSFIAGSTQDYVKYQGGNYTENYAFGHEYYYYISNSGSSNFSITCPNGMYNNYTILGVKTVQTQIGPIGSGVYGNPVDFTVTRTVVSGTVTYAIGTTVIAPADFLITLYTGTKFFEMSKQGRGIIDIYEMMLISASRDTNGNYRLDTGDPSKPIIAIATYTGYSPPYVIGTAYVYDGVTGSMIPVFLAGGVSQINDYLPVLNNSEYQEGLLPTRLWLSAPNTLNPTILVPVLVHSYVASSESAYSFYYNFNPYQGLLTSSSTEKGKIEKEGPAIVTSEGSGIVNNFTVNPSATDSAASITQTQRTVTQSGSNMLSWTTYVKPGDYFSISSPYYYRIISVDSDTQLTLAELYVEVTAVAQQYSIVRLDIPNSNVSNTMDIMPSSDATDYNGLGSEFSIASGGVLGTLIEIKEKVALQDPLDTIVNDFQLGLNLPPVNRGRVYFRLTDGENDFIKLGVLTPYIKYGNITWSTAQGYKKVYQAYLYNQAYYDGINYRDLTGRAYLLVVSSETNQGQQEILLNGFSKQDAVDIFELVGRPIIKTI
jgi:hypothetical protein